MPIADFIKHLFELKVCLKNRLSERVGAPCVAQALALSLAIYGASFLYVEYQATVTVSISFLVLPVALLLTMVGIHLKERRERQFLFSSWDWKWRAYKDERGQMQVYTSPYCPSDNREMLNDEEHNQYLCPICGFHMEAQDYPLAYGGAVADARAFADGQLKRLDREYLSSSVFNKAQ